MRIFKLSILLSLILHSLPLFGGTENIWIDVRTEAEYKQGHLEGAINIPHDQIASRIGDITNSKEKNINLYCRSGRRSELAKEILHTLGYLHARNGGGMLDIIAQGLKNKTNIPTK